MSVCVCITVYTDKLVEADPSLQDFASHYGTDQRTSSSSHKSAGSQSKVPDKPLPSSTTSARSRRLREGSEQFRYVMYYLSLIYL